MYCRSDLEAKKVDTNMFKSMRINIATVQVGFLGVREKPLEKQHRRERSEEKQEKCSNAQEGEMKYNRYSWVSPDCDLGKLIDWS